MLLLHRLVACKAGAGNSGNMAATDKPQATPTQSAQHTKRFCDRTSWELSPTLSDPRGQPLLSTPIMVGWQQVAVTQLQVGQTHSVYLRTTGTHSPAKSSCIVTASPQGQHCQGC